MASEKYYTILTKTGQAKIANALAFGRQLKLTHFALGDGNGTSYEPTENQTALRHEVYRATIANIVIADDSINMLEINMAVPADIGGFIVREMGIFDADGSLIALSKTPDDPKPGAGSGAAKDVIYRLFIVVTNTDAVEIKIDGTVAVATKAEVEKVSARVKLLESGLVVYASQAQPITEVKNYCWFQILHSKVTDENEPMLLQTSTEALSGYHVEVDQKREAITNAVSKAEAAKKDDLIIIEV